MSGTEGGSVDPKGEMGYQPPRLKAAREEREKLKEAEMEMDGEMPQEESSESQISKRKVIRAESEETQDYVRETLAISQEEAEESAFVPSAFSEPRGPIYFCDNRCNEKAVRYWQQEEEEALQLVVCGVRGQIRMESTQQDIGGAARY